MVRQVLRYAFVVIVVAITLVAAVAFIRSMPAPTGPRPAAPSYLPATTDASR